MRLFIAAAAMRPDDVVHTCMHIDPMRTPAVLQAAYIYTEGCDPHDIPTSCDAAIIAYHDEADNSACH